MNAPHPVLPIHESVQTNTMLEGQAQAYGEMALDTISQSQLNSPSAENRQEEYVQALVSVQTSPHSRTSEDSTADTLSHDYNEASDGIKSQDHSAKGQKGQKKKLKTPMSSASLRRSERLDKKNNGHRAKIINESPAKKQRVVMATSNSGQAKVCSKGTVQHPS
uniref:Uncharacterized protein n=1 Tax=Arundo donax TaxID=35708 RepID=A0A0A9CCR9_ARUDO